MQEKPKSVADYEVRKQHRKRERERARERAREDISQKGNEEENKERLARDRQTDRERRLVHPLRIALSDQRFRKRSPHEKYDENTHIRDDSCP